MTGRVAAERDFASGEAVSEFNSTLHQSSHGFATRVHGFATKTKAFACEIPPATQATEGGTCVRKCARMIMDLTILANFSQISLNEINLAEVTILANFRPPIYSNNLIKL